MRRVSVSLLCVLCGFVLLACERDRSVRAGNDEYRPRPAPKGEASPRDAHEVKGELLRVDIGRKTMSVRVQNGMEQTFKFDDSTVVMGLENHPAMRNLVGKEGSELTVKWEDSGGVKMASNIEVTQISTAKARRVRRK